MKTRLFLALGILAALALYLLSGSSKPEDAIRRKTSDLFEWVETGAGLNLLPLAIHLRAVEDYFTDSVELSVPRWTAPTVGIDSIQSLAAITFQQTSNIEISHQLRSIEILQNQTTAKAQLELSAKIVGRPRQQTIKENLSLYFQSIEGSWKIDRIISDSRLF
ncbi:MAG: hypothetical protein ACFCU4_11020 [Puniceicoccaceae bacterium]